jgi:hypothetical protein
VILSLPVILCWVAPLYFGFRLVWFYFFLCYFLVVCLRCVVRTNIHIYIIIHTGMNKFKINSVQLFFKSTVPLLRFLGIGICEAAEELGGL